jgi:hypothetical protein
MTHMCDVCGQEVNPSSGDYYHWNHTVTGWQGTTHGDVPEPLYRHGGCERSVRVLGRASERIPQTSVLNGSA